MPRSSREGEAVVSLLGLQATLAVPPGAEGELMELVTRLDRCRLGLLLVFLLICTGRY